MWCCEVESELSCYRACSRGCLHEHLRRNRVYSLTAGAASSREKMPEEAAMMPPCMLLCPTCKHPEQEEEFPCSCLTREPSFQFGGHINENLNSNCYINDIRGCKKKKPQKWLPFKVKSFETRLGNYLPKSQHALPCLVPQIKSVCGNILKASCNKEYNSDQTLQI